MQSNQNKPLGTVHPSICCHAVINLSIRTSYNGTRSQKAERSIRLAQRVPSATPAESSFAAHFTRPSINLAELFRMLPYLSHDVIG
jgi:hypothetical protein